MEGYVMSLNILKQFLFGITFGNGSFAISLGCFSIEVHCHNIGTGAKLFDLYNEFRDEPKKESAK